LIDRELPPLAAAHKDPQLIEHLVLAFVSVQQFGAICEQLRLRLSVSCCGRVARLPRDSA
jgi:hypothetical protein